MKTKLFYILEILLTLYIIYSLIDGYKNYSMPFWVLIVSTFILLVTLFFSYPKKK